jgi:signal transduction histidine kinase
MNFSASLDRLRQAFAASAYVALSLVIATVAFIVTVTGAALGFSLLIVALAGLPILWLTFAFCHGLAHFERRRIAALLGVDFRIRTLPRDGSLPRRMLAWTRSRGSWLELLYALVALPVVGWLGSVLVFGAWSAALAFVSFPAWGWATAGDGAVPGWDLAYLPSSLLHVGAGIAIGLAAPYLARSVAGAQMAIARLLLEPGDHERLTARVDTLRETRAGMVAAADAERRRIERDLHDGAQQRLVALAMTLGRAKASEDPALARTLLDEAHGEAKEALVELRNLARGIHPAVLTDRGLDAAVSALAARSPVPVTVEVDLPRRAAPAVEAIAYFVVAEALTNVARHAQATHVRLFVAIDGNTLVLEIADDGCGGADAAAGSGLAGLRDRVRSVDGRLAFVSPPGDGTTLRVELPCEP